jgi:hypothetical protein
MQQHEPKYHLNTMYKYKEKISMKWNATKVEIQTSII